ncbi:unnamed protein product [Spirodela intermedia]|uniref:Ribulose bisphosphate carboxylase large subunit C-terminal domain-containing protein n=1 Tax=Spirodela intermedia TaxID=51605 RepID=A0A7I8JP57_SPIIN|nr:unnamed protein product [Spirodela intermedia]CAA6671958.1 unnamed protein product [Spirodela intermedia]
MASKTFSRCTARGGGPRAGGARSARRRPAAPPPPPAAGSSCRAPTLFGYQQIKIRKNKDKKYIFLVIYCQDNGLLLHIHHTIHAIIDRQKNHGMHFHVLAKALCKLEGERKMTLGFVDLLCDDYIEKDQSRGNAPSAVANCVTLKACVQAHNEGCDLAREGNEIICEACKWSPELVAACEVWKEIKFEFKSVDKLDVKG